MSFFGDLFKPSTSKTTTTAPLPAWLESAGKNNYSLAQQVAARPYQPYQFSRIAGFTPDQANAQQRLRTWQPKEMTPGYAGYKPPRMIDNIPGSGAAGEGAGTVQDYMNPYIDQVLGRTQGRIREAMDMAKQWQAGTAAHQEGAFGDSRHGVADAEIEKGGIKEMGDTAASAYAAAYDNAQGQRSDDINRLFSAEGFNRAGNDEVLKYIDSLYRSGSNQQALNQQNQTMMYEDFLKQQGYPAEQLSILMQALGQAPYTKTETTKTPGPSVAGSILGTGASLLGSALTGGFFN